MTGPPRNPPLSPPPPPSLFDPGKHASPATRARVLPAQSLTARANPREEMSPFTRPSAARILPLVEDRKSTRLNSSHLVISYAVFCLKKKKRTHTAHHCAHWL